MNNHFFLNENNQSREERNKDEEDEEAEKDKEKKKKNDRNPIQVRADFIGDEQINCDMTYLTNQNIPKDWNPKPDQCLFISFISPGGGVVKFPIFITEAKIFCDSTSNTYQMVFHKCCLMVRLFLSI